MKSKAPINVVFGLLVATTGLVSLIDIFRWKLWDYATAPLRGLTVSGSDYALFILTWVAIIGSIVSLVFAFLSFQKNQAKKTLLFAGIAAASYILIAGFLSFIRMLKFEWAAVDALRTIFIGGNGITTYLSGIVSTILYVVLLVLLFTYSSNQQINPVVLQAGSPDAAAGMSMAGSPAAPIASMPNQSVQPAPPAMAVSSNAQWKVQIPGQLEQVIDTLTLQMWARSGALKSNTLVQDVTNNKSYLAGSIPGLFSSKSYVTALLLSFFLGSLGVDRFYLGHVGLGIGKLLTFGGCGIWSLIDFILIAVRKVNDSNGQPLA